MPGRLRGCGPRDGVSGSSNAREQVRAGRAAAAGARRVLERR